MQGGLFKIILNNDQNDSFYIPPYLYNKFMNVIVFCLAFHIMNIIPEKCLNLNFYFCSLILYKLTADFTYTIYISFFTKAHYLYLMVTNTNILHSSMKCSLYYLWLNYIMNEMENNFT